MAKDWFMFAIIGVLVLLVIGQLSGFALTYRVAQRTDDKISVLETQNRALAEALDLLQTRVGEQASSLGADILNTKTELGERILGLEERVETSEETFGAKLLTLEQNQEQTKTQLEKSIRGLQLSNQDFSSTIQNVLPSVVSVLTDSGQGSGVIVTSDGFVMTNYHVIEDASAIRVLTYDGKVYPVEIIGFARGRDLAILDIRADEQFEKLKFTTSVVVGENVVAIGNPGGLGFTVTEGIVSSENRVVDSQRFIQISAPINPGNSGGPLVDIEGNVVGINTLKFGGFEGVGFAIPGADAQNILDQALAQSTN